MLTKTVKVSLTSFLKENGKTVKKDGKAVKVAEWSGMVTFEFPDGYGLEQLANDCMVNTTQSPVVKYASVYRPMLTADGSFEPPKRVNIAELYKQKAVVDPVTAFVNSPLVAQIKALKAMLTNATDSNVRKTLEATIASLEATLPKS